MGNTMTTVACGCFSLWVPSFEDDVFEVEAFHSASKRFFSIKIQLGHNCNRYSSIYRYSYRYSTMQNHIMTMTSSSSRSDPAPPLPRHLSRAQSNRRSKRTGFTSSVSKKFQSKVQSARILKDKIALHFGSNPNWERLNDIERRRLNGLGRTDVFFVRMLFYWDGTVLQAVLMKPLMWITLAIAIAIYIAVRIGARWGMPSFVSTLGSIDTAVIGGLLTFFLVFHVHDSVGRFNTLFNASKDGRGRIHSIAALARIDIPCDRALRLIWYLNAAHVASYVGLSDVYTFDAFFQPLNEATHLLTEEEVMHMKCRMKEHQPFKNW